MNLLAGILSEDWNTLKKSNSFGIKYLPIKWYYNLKSKSNDKLAEQERAAFAQELEKVSLKTDPLFILGHWRSGTTMLHNTICRDEQFAFPNLLEVYNPHTFLTLEEKIAEKLEKEGSVKRPMDNVHIRHNSPAEDEFALAILSLCSPVLGWPFPKRRHEYDRFLLLDDITSDELQRWQKALKDFVTKLTFRYEKPVVLKSPQHTARVAKILHLFPNAKFIHFRRNPYDVYKSTLNLYTKTVRALAFQSVPDDDLEDYIIGTYKTMYQRFMREKELIPDSNIVEIAYEDFIADTDAGLKHIYSSLDLNDVDRLVDTLKKQQQQKSSYKRNTYEQLDVSTKQKINREWEPFFHEWNYPLL